MSEPTVPNNFLPPQTATPLQPGATSPMNSVQIQQQQQTEQQMRLIGKSGGSKRYGNKCSYGNKRMRGGVTPSVVVPPPPAGTPNANQSAGQYASLNALAAKQSSEATFDNATSASQTAQLQQQQQAVYKAGTRNHKGGMRHKQRKYKSRKVRKSRKSVKGRKSRKTRRMTRKH